LRYAFIQDLVEIREGFCAHDIFHDKSLVTSILFHEDLGMISAVLSFLHSGNIFERRPKQGQEVMLDLKN